MHDTLHEHTAHLAQLGTTLRNGLQAAKASIPTINQHLAAVGVTVFRSKDPLFIPDPQTSPAPTKRALKIERGMVEGNLDLGRDKITLVEAIDAYDAFLVCEGRAPRTLTQYRHTFKLMRQIATELGRPLRI